MSENTWRDRADAVIADVHSSLPADATLKMRRSALRAAKPYEFAATSWGTKVWSKASRAYLEKHGLEPLRAADVAHLSPLERLYAKSTGASA